MINPVLSRSPLAPAIPLAATSALPHLAKSHPRSHSGWSALSRTSNSVGTIEQNGIKLCCVRRQGLGGSCGRTVPWTIYDSTLQPPLKPEMNPPVAMSHHLTNSDRKLWISMLTFVSVCVVLVLWQIRTHSKILPRSFHWSVIVDDALAVVLHSVFWNLVFAVVATAYGLLSLEVYLW